MPKQGSKTSKSSKTARVLNLLTDPEAVEETKERDVAEAEKSSDKLTDDRKTQAKIRGALEMELAEQAPPSPPKAAKAPKAAPKAAKGTAPTVRPAPVEEVPPVEEAAPTPAPAFTVPTPPQAPLSSVVEELRSAGDKAPDEYICFNVTQALVEDKADKYINMFGLCSCARCRIDVIALALSNLPAKYVVAKPHELIPRLSIYEQKYNAAVVTQVMGACKKVLDRPHHEREQP